MEVYWEIDFLAPLCSAPLTWEVDVELSYLASVGAWAIIKKKKAVQYVLAMLYTAL